MSDSPLTITAVETWACSLPLPHPLSFRTFVVRSREYAVLRIRTARGLVADTVALSRRSPIDVAIADVLAPALVGRDAGEVEERMVELAGATRALDEHGVIGRACSLVESCLWDLRAQAAGQPLWQALGGAPRELPVLLVEGYPLPGESHRAFAERLAARVGEGYTALKLEAASYEDAAELTERLRLLRELAGDRVQLVVDMAWSWQTLAEALAAARQWAPYALTWIEDPFARSRAADVAALRAQCGSPIAAGDEATRPGELTDLLAWDAVDVLRLDATAIGGLSATAALARAAATAGVRASAHVHPELHHHCALASPAFEHVEAFPLDRPFDCAHELLQRAFMDDVRDGRAQPPQAPGSGMRLNLDAVRRTAYRHAIEHQEES
ncbi:MAG TPA: enolase C-terminal domain-like protein [Conexibacter sp.]|nr:enolase C-terminal domain-like protein [Conexibacter sp.]